MGNHEGFPYTESSAVAADWDAPARVWEQFCAEINIVRADRRSSRKRLMP